MMRTNIKIFILKLHCMPTKIFLILMIGLYQFLNMIKKPATQATLVTFTRLYLGLIKPGQAQTLNIIHALTHLAYLTLLTHEGFGGFNIFSQIVFPFAGFMIIFGFALYIKWSLQWYQTWHNLVLELTVGSCFDYLYVFCCPAVHPNPMITSIILFIPQDFTFN